MPPLSLLSSTLIQPRDGTARSPLSTTEGSSGTKRGQERGWPCRRHRPGLFYHPAPRRIYSRPWGQSLDLSGPGVKRYANSTLWMIHLTTLRSCNTGRHSISDRIRSVFRTGHGQNSKLSKHTIDPSAIDKDKSERKSSVYATTKLAIEMVKESSDVFPPLKSVAGGLSAILNHCDV